jgi:hypothetical protein
MGSPCGSPHQGFGRHGSMVGVLTGKVVACGVHVSCDQVSLARM